MGTLIQHIIKLTDHRERDRLELTLAKGLVDQLVLQRVVVAKLVAEAGVRRWMQIATLDTRGGGMVTDPLRVDFEALPLLESDLNRLQCLRQQLNLEFAMAGETGPRITYFPLFASDQPDEGVLEIHSALPLGEAELQTTDALLRVYRNMFALLAYSDRDGLTGLLNRKALENTFYSAVLEELDEGSMDAPAKGAQAPGEERRHRVPPNYWLGVVQIDHYGILTHRHGFTAAEDALPLVARILNNTFRTYDRIYRLGAEQFAVLMHCPEEALVLAAFERLRANVEKFVFPQLGLLTVSSGFVRISPDDTPSRALERAQAAAALGESAGNQVFSASSISEG